MILVVGATGSLGNRIARSLLAGGVKVRALVRPASDSAPLAAAGAVIAAGDLNDPESLVRACTGTSAVVTTASMSKRGDDSVENVDLKGNLNLVEAARQAGAGRFVFVSTVGASPDHPLPLFRAKGLTEQRLRESGLEFAILQAEPFMDVWFQALIEAPVAAGHPVTLVGDSHRRHSFVAERDVAAFAVAALHHPAARNEAILVGGPEAITFRDVIRAYEAALGRVIPTRSVAPGEPLPGVPEQVWGLAASLETFDSPVPMEETARCYGVSMTSVGEFARARQFASARP